MQEFMKRCTDPYLIVGLGNPGKTYERTRHNIGFLAAENLSEKYGFTFKKKLLLKGHLARGTIQGNEVLLLMPRTYINLSGESVVRVMRYCHVELPKLMILTDDVAIPLGQLRIRINSSAGGHNGLKSIEECLNTKGYARFRIGVGGPKGENLSDYVLGKFSKEEEKLIPDVLERVVQSVEIWLDKGLTSAMNYANSSSTPSIGGERET